MNHASKAKGGDQPATPPRFLTTPEACSTINGPLPTFNHYRKTDPTFPKPVRLGPSPQAGIRWVESELHEWMARRMAAREVENANASAAALALVRRRINKRAQAETAEAA